VHPDAIVMTRSGPANAQRQEGRPTVAVDDLALLKKRPVSAVRLIDPPAIGADGHVPPDATFLSPLFRANVSGTPIPLESAPRGASSDQRFGMPQYCC